MIVTENIKFTSKELFQIYITSYLKRRWWMVLWIWLTIAILLFRESNATFDYFIVVALIAIQLIIAYQFWGNAKSTDIQEKHYEIDPDKIVIIAENGTTTSIENRLFISVLKVRSNYLLYTTKVEFIVLPISSFKNLEDRTWFENNVIAKIKK